MSEDNKGLYKLNNDQNDKDIPVSTTNHVYFPQQQEQKEINENVDNGAQIINTQYNFNQNENNMNENRGFDTNSENNNNNNYNNQYYQNADTGFNSQGEKPFQTSIPNSGAILTLGIISIITICCCLWPVGIALSIIALVLVPKAKEIYSAAPDHYTLSSLSNINAGRTCAIIGLIMNVLLVVYAIVVLSGDGMDLFMEAFDEAWNQYNY